MRILICTCCKDSAPIEYTQSMVNARISVDHDFLFVKGAAINEARDMAARNAIMGGFTHLMFIDDDIMFPPDAIQKLIDMNWPIAAGLYFTKAEHSMPVAWERLYLEDDQIQADPLILQRNETIYEVDAVGMGFTLIQVDVIKDVLKHNKSTFYPLHFASEDITFCYLANQLGYRVMLNITTGLLHIGSYRYSMASYVAAMSQGTGQALRRIK